MQPTNLVHRKLLLALPKCIGMFLLLLTAITATSQTFTVGNIGSPAALTFPSISGNKVVLAGDGNTFHTGIGIQGGLLQFYTAGTTGNIVFNSFSQGFFNTLLDREVMRIAGPGRTSINNSNPDPNARLDIKGHLLLRSKNASETAGIVLSNSDFTGDNFFVGMKDDNSIGFYTNLGNPGWRLWTNLATGALGINNGYGAPGAILTAGGETGPANWQLNSDVDYYNLSNEAQESSSYTLTDASPIAALSGLNITQNYTKTTRVEIQVNVQASGVSCTFCGPTDLQVSILVNGGVWKTFRHYVNNRTTSTLNGVAYIQLAPGTHSISVQVQKLAGPTLQMTADASRKSNLILLAVPAQ